MSSCSAIFNVRNASEAGIVVISLENGIRKAEFKFLFSLLYSVCIMLIFLRKAWVRLPITAPSYWLNSRIDRALQHCLAASLADGQLFIQNHGESKRKLHNYLSQQVMAIHR